jgi:hypothetical protein
MRKMLLAVVALVCALAVLPLVAQDANEPIDVIGGDEAALREFISRTFVPLYGLPNDDTRRILIGELPAEFPFALPIPENARVIGSMVLGDAVGTQVILDSPEPPDAVIDFYTTALNEAGWETIQPGVTGAGFANSTPIAAVFCDADENYVLVTAVRMGEGSTDVRIHTQSPAQLNQCSPIPQANSQPGAAILPALEVPPGATMQGGGSSSGSNGEWGITASLLSDLSAAELAESYNQQLEAAGWTMIENGSAEGMAWSTWTTEDAEAQAWAGTLIVLESPAADARSAFLQVAPVRE